MANSGSLYINGKKATGSAGTAEEIKYGNGTVKAALDELNKYTNITVYEHPDKTLQEVLDLYLNYDHIQHLKSRSFSVLTSAGWFNIDVSCVADYYTGIAINLNTDDRFTFRRPYGGASTVISPFSSGVEPLNLIKAETFTSNGWGNRDYTFAQDYSIVYIMASSGTDGAGSDTTINLGEEVTNLTQIRFDNTCSVNFKLYQAINVKAGTTVTIRGKLETAYTIIGI